IAAGVAGKVSGDRQATEIQVAPGEHALAEGRVAHDVGLDRVLDPARVLLRQPRFGHPERPRERLPAGHDVRNDGDVGARDLFEEHDRPAAAALVLEHEGHDVVLGRHRLAHTHDLARARTLVRRHEIPHALSGHPQGSSMMCGTNGDSFRVMSPSLSRMPTPADSRSTTQLPTIAGRPSYTGSSKYCW